MNRKGTRANHLPLKWVAASKPAFVGQRLQPKAVPACYLCAVFSWNSCSPRTSPTAANVLTQATKQMRKFYIPSSISGKLVALMVAAQGVAVIGLVYQQTVSGVPIKFIVDKEGVFRRMTKLEYLEERLDVCRCHATQ